MVTRHSSGTSLGFESLEQKQLMAGDVAIGVNGSNLFLMGDDLLHELASNHIPHGRTMYFV